MKQQGEQQTGHDLTATDIFLISLSLFFILVLFCIVDLLLEALIDKQQRVSVRRRPDGRTDGRTVV